MGFYLYFLILAFFAEIVNPIAKLVISVGRQREEAKTDIEVHPVTVEAKRGKCPI